MSAHHIPGPCSFDHDSDADVTALETLDADEAVIAEILGHTVHQGHARLTRCQRHRISQLLAWHEAAAS